MQRIAPWKVGFASAAVAWALALPAAAWTISNSPAPDLRSAVGTIAYLAGAVVCHQRPERSFALAGEPLPVCARCTGIYLGAALAALWLLGRSRGSRRRLGGQLRPRLMQVVAIVAAAPTIVTLVYEWTTADMPSNMVRAAAGLPLGVVVAWMVMRSADVAEPQNLPGRSDAGGRAQRQSE